MVAPGVSTAEGLSKDQNARRSVVGKSAQRKAALRLIPVISIGYGLAYIDRLNLSFASLQMNRDLHFSASVYGFGAGMFFIGYALCEVPSNLLLLHFGAKRWLARIMFTWGLLAAAMMFVRTPLQFNVLRLLLGMAEAGFFPGVIYYLTLWFPARMRARAIARFYIALPLSSVVMGSLAGWLLGLGGKLGLAGWQWLFLVEGLPAVLFSIVILKMLPDWPDKVAWLTAEEKSWLQDQLEADSKEAHLGHEAGIMKALLSPKVWTIGMFFFCALTCSYAYNFYAPSIYQQITGWSVTNVGFCGVHWARRSGRHVAERFPLRPYRRTPAALHCAVSDYGRRLCYRELFAAAVGGDRFAGHQLHCLQRASGTSFGDSYSVSSWTRRRHRHRRHEHDYHVQRLCGPLLDGLDEGSYRKRSGWLAGFARA